MSGIPVTQRDAQNDLWQIQVMAFDGLPHATYI